MSEFGRNLDEVLSRIKSAKVLVIGDAIIDKYTFVKTKGRAIKDPILSTEYVNEETYAGGSLAIAKHVSSFADNVSLFTMLGDRMDHLEFIQNNLPSNIKFDYFTKPDSPTTVKQRHIDFHRGTKMFKMEYINDKPVNSLLEKEIVKKLTDKIPDYDVVIVGDFGHGMLTPRMRRVIENYSSFLSVNAQVNSSNMGYNFVTLYKKADFVTMNENEIRLPLMMADEPIKKVMQTFADRYGFPNFLLTLGKKGSRYYNFSTVFTAPAFVKNHGDTVGAGDAGFSVASLFVYGGIEPSQVPVVANSAAAIKIQYMGNKSHVTKEELLTRLNRYYGMG